MASITPATAIKKTPADDPADGMVGATVPDGVGVFLASITSVGVADGPVVGVAVGVSVPVGVGVSMPVGVGVFVGVGVGVLVGVGVMTPVGVGVLVGVREIVGVTVGGVGVGCGWAGAQAGFVKFQ